MNSNARRLTPNLRYESVIGMEVHAQLLTESKMFCTCSAHLGDAPPNTLVCPICLGMPGTLPVINEQAVAFTIMTGLALNCTIPEFSKFDRKNYNYPDLMKGYQISQYDLALCRDGWLEIELPDGQGQAVTKRIGIRRVHLEEDTARSLHRQDELGQTYSLLDVNRSGVPLMEIVTEPDIRSAEEAFQYLVQLRTILRYLKVSTANMEEGAMRCEPNLSLRPRGSEQFGTRIEVKNLNSFRAVRLAVACDIKRLADMLDRGEAVVQETRGWREDLGVTVVQRTKEEASDYRYFPEPDLPPLFISPAQVERLRAGLPELPAARHRRFIAEYALSPGDAGVLTSSRPLADYYERAVAAYGQAHGGKKIANWVLRDVRRLLNETGQELSAPGILLKPEYVAELQRLLDDGTLSVRSAPEVLEASFRTGVPPTQVMGERGLAQVSEVGELDAAVERAIADNPKAVEDVVAGKKQALGFLVGQVMKETRGRANPGLVHQLLARKLQG